MNEGRPFVEFVPDGRLLKLVISVVMLVVPAADRLLVVFVVVVVVDVVELLFAFDEVAEATSILQAEKMVIDTKKNKDSFFILLSIVQNLSQILKKQIIEFKSLFSVHKL